MSKIKQMTQTKFLSQYTGIRNIIKRRVDVLHIKIGGFKFTPARKFLEIKLSHDFRYFQLYSASEHVTYLFLIDDGFVSLVGNRWYRKWDNNGYLIKLDGELENMDEFLDEHGRLLTKIYNEHEEEIKTRIQEDKEKQTA